MAYYPPPSYGDATYMPPNNSNSNNNQGAQTPDYGDPMDMLNDDAFGEEDEVAFVDAPEHQDDMAAPTAGNNGGSGPQQQQVQGNVYGVAGAGEAKPKPEQQEPQQQMDDHDHRSHTGPMTAATHNFNNAEDREMEVDDDSQTPQQQNAQPDNHGTDAATTPTWDFSRPNSTRENEGMGADGVAEEPQQKVAQDSQHGAGAAATATMDFSLGTQTLENDDMIMDRSVQELPRPSAQNGHQDIDAAVEATADVDHTAPARENDEVDTDDDVQEPQQETGHNGYDAMGPGSIGSETLQSQIIAGDGKPSIPASPPRPTKRIRYDPNEEPQEVRDISKDAGRDTYTAAYRAALAKKSPHCSQPESSQPRSQSTKLLECGHSPGADTPPESPLLEATQSIGPAKPTPTAPAAQPWCGPDPNRDVPRAIVTHKKWHDRVAPLHPDLYLTPHRYWVGVLNPATKPRYATKEEHFLWFKANRLTTVETVWQTYSAITAEIDFSFFLAGEKLGLTDSLEELDICGDKVVILNVVEDEDGVQGRKVSERLIPNVPDVIELD